MRSTLPSRSRGLPSLLAGAFAALTLAALALPVGTGCSSSSTEATKSPATRCTPGNYVFCRCQDRQEGTKLCMDDGQSFGKCEPCESDTNPELPPEEDPEPRPVDPVDGGTDGSAASKCGNKIVDDGEDCDDGNKIDNDGCDSACKLAGTDPPASRGCPGLDAHVWSKPVTWSSTTVGSPNTGTAAPTCGSATGDNPTTGAAASDRVIKVTAHKTGTMTVATTDVDFNSFLYVSDACKVGDNTWLKCANKVNGVGGETMSFPVTAGKVYTVFVDGAGISGHQGVFRVTLSIQ